MKVRISKKTKRLTALYLVILVVLYIMIFQLPKVTDLFEKTQVLEVGSIETTCEAVGYVVKDEAVCIASSDGVISYKLNEGTVVKKGTSIASISGSDNSKKSTDKEKSQKNVGKKYRSYLESLGKYDLLKETCKAPISGVFSTSIDGYEKYFSIDNLKNIRKEKTESLTLSQLELERDDVRKGEPIFKISGDDNWYIVCWLEKDAASKYSEKEDVRISLPEGTVDGTVQSIEREGDYYRTVFYLNVYYKDFCSSRDLDMTVTSDSITGLIVDNDCIIEKNGEKGVYVETKDGETYFAPVKVKAQGEEQSVLYESVFTNDDYEQVETVKAYQEVLKNPQKELEEDLKNDI